MRRCAVIKTPSFAAIEQASRKADLIELRLDLMLGLSLEEVRRLRAACKVPVIFKGGEAFLSLKPDYVDLPDHIPSPGTARIRSWHDWGQTPRDLSVIFDKPAAHYKIATQANSTLDCLRMLAFVKTHRVLGFCLGEKGSVTRLLAPIIGAPWMYAPLDEEHRTDPGQITLDALPDVSQETALYGLIGDPLTQSPGVRLHNHAFRLLGVDALYVNLPLAQEELPEAFPLIRELGFRGLSVTRPLKEAIRPFLDEGPEIVNTVVFGERVVGFNTDAPAAEELLGVVARQRVAILGKGATGRAIADVLRRAGATVCVYGRGEMPTPYDVLVNTTPAAPLSPEAVLPGTKVMDLRLDASPLLDIVREKGCVVIDGMDFWMAQAKRQLCTWLLPQN